MKTKILKLFILLFVIALSVIFAAMYLNSKTPTNSNSPKIPDNEITEESSTNKEDTKDDADKEEPEKKELTEEERITAKAEEILAEMTLREKLYQMFIVTPDTLSGETGTKSVTSALKNGIKTFPVGGIIFFPENIESAKQLKNMIKKADKQSEIPMFFSTDQEGGMVARLKENVNFPIFKNMYKYKDMGEGTAYENAKTIAVNMAELGFNLDFAPVADVWTNKENTVIGERAYSDDYTVAAKLVESAVRGFNDGGIICTVKHFPGHGDTYADTHQNLAYVSKTKEQLINQELLPFKSGIQAGAGMVMAGHLVVPEIDNQNPATLSKAVLTDFLKNELGYEGIIITDALNMGAVANMYSSGQLCAMAVKAGVDILLMPTQLRAGAAGIESAVLSGEISEERINESVLKILKLKIKRGIIK